MTITKDFRTVAEKKRESLHSEIVNRFKNYREKNPELPDNRIFIAIAGELELSVTAVRNVCFAQGVAQKKRVS